MLALHLTSQCLEVEVTLWFIAMKTSQQMCLLDKALSPQWIHAGLATISLCISITGDIYILYSAIVHVIRWVTEGPFRRVLREKVNLWCRVLLTLMFTTSYTTKRSYITERGIIMCNFSQLIIVISIINVLPLKNVICWENSFPICLVSGNKNVLTWQHHISYVFNKKKAIVTHCSEMQ